MSNLSKDFTGSGNEGTSMTGKELCGTVRGFMDLRVYQDSYRSMLIVFKKILPILPKEERYDLFDQLRRSVKAIPRLIAEGHSKRHQNKGFQKYLDDAHAESNESIVSLYQVRDLYATVDVFSLCDELINTYDMISRQLYRLSLSWDNYHKKQNRHARLKTPNDSPDASC